MNVCVCVSYNRSDLYLTIYFLVFSTIEQTGLGCHASTTSWVVGSSGHPENKATKEIKEVFCRQDSQDATSTAEKEAVADVHAFKKESELKSSSSSSSCELEILLSNPVLEENNRSNQESNCVIERRGISMKKLVEVCRM